MSEEQTRSSDADPHTARLDETTHASSNRGWDDDRDERHDGGDGHERHDGSAGVAGAAGGTAAAAGSSARTSGSDVRRFDDYADQGPVVEAPERAVVVARQKAAFGGVKPFVAFFGWLTATGMAVLLTALLAALGGSFYDVNTASPATAVDSAGLSVETISWIGVVVVLLVVFISYYAGGYVAGRMARFDGMRQGVAVWLWAVVISVTLGLLSYFFGLGDSALGSVSNLQLPTGGLSSQALVVLIGIIVVSLVAAILGGLAGMHFHRKVDVAGLGR